MAEVNISSIFSDALSGASSMTQQAAGVYQQAQNAFTSRRDMNTPTAPADWAANIPAPPSTGTSPYVAPQQPYYPPSYDYGYGYGVSNGYSNWATTNQNQGYPGFASPTYGKGGY